MGSMNRVILIGNLGRDAEVRFTQGGEAVANFSVATTEKWTGKDGQKQERTEWSRIVLWGKAAEALQQYLTKGKQVAIEGKLQTREWEDKDGVKRKTTEIIARQVTLLGGGGKRDDAGDGDAGSQEREPRQRRGRADAAPAPDEPQAQPVAANPADDDIPF